MQETPNLATEKRILRWRFWLYAIFSLLVIITVVLYLPMRFQYFAIANGTHQTMMEGAPTHQDQGAHTTNIIHEEAATIEGFSINLSPRPSPVLTNIPIELDFFTNIQPYNVPVPAYALEFNHTKLMHVIGIRSDMNEFFHIHPAPSVEMPGHFLTNYTFSNPGLYKIWSEVQRNGVTHVVGHREISVGGGGTQPLKEVFFSNSSLLIGPNGNYQVLFNHDGPAPTNREVILSFDIHDANNREVPLEQYLGAAMHLSVIKDDWKQFIHTHPEDGGAHTHSKNPSLFPVAHANGTHDATAQTISDSTHGVQFRVTFPESGIYKVFGQFRPTGIRLPTNDALTASFWIKVEETRPVTFSNWWVNLIVSIGLIIVLSKGVKKFLEVRI